MPTQKTLCLPAMDSAALAIDEYLPKGVAETHHVSPTCSLNNVDNNAGRTSAATTCTFRLVYRHTSGTPAARIADERCGVWRL
jgi:hypothetical protein